MTVQRADIEVDVDMENTNDGCYLWGALVTDRRVAVPTASYVAFASWDPDIESGELLAFKDFWSWFADLRAKASGEGASFKAYCYSKSAEQGQMTRMADRIGLRDEVDEFLASADWVDLLKVVRNQLITGRSMGLKETAPLAGFAWRAGTARARWPWSSTSRRLTKRRVPSDEVSRKSGSSSTTKTTCGRQRPCETGSTDRRGSSLGRDGTELSGVATVSLPVRASGRRAE